MIYFIQEVDNEQAPIKIGRAADPKKRLREIQTSTPNTLEIRATIPLDRAREKTLHDIFAEERIRGEWFTPSELLLDLIVMARLKVYPTRDMDRGRLESFLRISKKRISCVEVQQVTVFDGLRPSRKAQVQTDRANVTTTPWFIRAGHVVFPFYLGEKLQHKFLFNVVLGEGAEMATFEPHEITYLDQDCTNLTIENLRIESWYPVRGVSYVRDRKSPKKFRVQVRPHTGKHKIRPFLDYFETREEAVNAATLAYERLHAEWQDWWDGVKRDENEKWRRSRAQNQRKRRLEHERLGLPESAWVEDCVTDLL